MKTLILLALAAAATGSAHASHVNRWHGTAVGGVLQTRHYASTNGHVVADDTSAYRGRLTFSFRAAKNGTIHGTGSGTYTAVTWHETGTVDGHPFSCDAPKTAQPFSVAVGGHVSGGTTHLSLSIPAATEVLATNVDCGYGHYLVAGTTTYLRDSLVTVGGAAVRIRHGRDVIAQLTKHADFTQDAAPPTLPGTFHVVQDHNWKVEVKTR